eukprot:348019_1
MTETTEHVTLNPDELIALKKLQEYMEEHKDEIIESQQRSAQNKKDAQNKKEDNAMWCGLAVCCPNCADIILVSCLPALIVLIVVIIIATTNESDLYEDVASAGFGICFMLWVVCHFCVWCGRVANETGPVYTAVGDVFNPCLVCGDCLGPCCYDAVCN